MKDRLILAGPLVFAATLALMVSAKACPPPFFIVYQTNGIIETTQSDTFSAFWVTWHEVASRCVPQDNPVSAMWSSSGGTLNVINGGTQAIFWSTKTGKYTVTATYGSYSKNPAVLVQVSNETVLSDLGCTQNPSCPGYPAGGLIKIANGGFIGAAALGGANGDGEVFELVPSGAAYSIIDLFDFTRQSGTSPYGGVIADSAGSLFGTAFAGGNTFTSCPLPGGFYGCGTVFKLTTSPHGSALTVLHAFTGGSDGYNPTGRLLMGNSGDFFGTTVDGGSQNCSQGCGTVFRLARVGGTWREFVLHRFGGGRDGTYPFSGVVADASGNLYGTTASGGGTSCSGFGAGCGVVFELVRGANYTYRILHRFQGRADGGLPVSGLTIDGTGSLYGTTMSGVVYKLTPSGAGYSLTVLHTFGAEASVPMSGLLDNSGTLYGMTSLGGQDSGGVVYSLTPSGSSYEYKLLHTFEAQPLDGSNDPNYGPYFSFGWPTSPLAFENGVLYGTTYAGGLTLGVPAGSGTMFEVRP